MLDYKIKGGFYTFAHFPMRMAPLLFADENSHLWAFSKRKGVYNNPS
jgi:hypothetical protein